MANAGEWPKKVRLRRHLFRAGLETLQDKGWSVERVPRAGKSSLRRIRKDGKSLVVAIRTTQDQYIAFPRNAEDKAWVTLSEVDAVVAVSVDDPTSPKFALVHMINGDEMRDRFDRTYAARVAANHSIPIGRGVWLPLYLPDAATPPAQVGGGAGLDNPPIARVPLQLPRPGGRTDDDDAREIGEDGDPEEVDRDDERLSIGEAKRRLALSLGVSAANIKITVEA